MHEEQDVPGDAPPAVPGSSDRRGFLKRMVNTVGVLPLGQGLVGATALGTTCAVASEPATPVPAPAATTMPATAAAAVATGYLCFSQAEAAFVETMVNLMCPADELTPNGVDCGLAVYIDRQLAGEFGQGARLYQRGPWQQAAPAFGYQLPLTPQRYFSIGVEVANDACVKRLGKPFDQISAPEAQAFLTGLADDTINDDRISLATWFDALIYPLFVQACFADPIYGGNVGKVFWKMIGYPGLPATHTIDMVRYRGKPFPGALQPK